MADKIKFIELNYHYHSEFSTPGEVISKHRPSNLFVSAFAENADIVLVKHIDFKGNIAENNIRYQFFKSKNSFIHIPFTTHRFVKKEKPDLILVQGLIFPLQVIALRMKLGKHCKIVLQHQGEAPFRKKKIFQKIADRSVDAYMFTSNGNAEEWIKAGIIKSLSKCYEIPDASTTFSRQDKDRSRQKTGMKSGINFLWVGRLNENKDPLTVLSGVEKYFKNHTNDKLYMIYGENDLLETVKKRIQSSSTLNGKVILVGKIDHDQLQDWYSAADYFVSGSHREGGGYALREAMACGCIPIVSNIPPFMKSIDKGKAGYYYQVGGSDALLRTLSTLDHEKQPEMSILVEKEFKNNLSPAAIADKMFAMYRDLTTI